jgi:hypothetical protein
VTSYATAQRSPEPNALTEPQLSVEDMDVPEESGDKENVAAPGVNAYPGAQQAKKRAAEEVSETVKWRTS